MVIDVFKFTFLILTLLISSACSKRERQYPLPNNTFITIEFDDRWEYERSAYYKVIRNGKEIVPKTYFETSENPDFIVFKADTLYGISTQDDPKKILIFFDSETLESWPLRLPDEEYELTQLRGNTLLNRFNNMIEFQIN